MLLVLGAVAITWNLGPRAKAKGPASKSPVGGARVAGASAAGPWESPKSGKKYWAFPPEGFARADRTPALDALAKRLPMSKKQRQHVDAMLALRGKEMFDVPATRVTAEAVDKEIQSVEKKRSMHLAHAEANSYVLGKGLLEVSDGEAYFQPTARPNVSYKNSNHSGLYGQLTPMQVSNLLQWGGPDLVSKMNEAQEATLRKQLEGAGAILNDEMPAPSNIRDVIKYASNEPDGSVYLEFSNASRLTLAPSGAIVEKIVPWNAK